MVNVFLRHGFGALIDQMHLGRYIPFRKRLRSFGRWPVPGERSVAERLRMAFAELGPSFIKLAQLLSTHPELIGSLYAEEFKKLQDRVPPFPAGEARGIVEEEIGAPLERAFAEFEADSTAAASIAQVHRARLAEGDRVIVKVRRPGIKEQLAVDIDILHAVANLLDRHVPESKLFNPRGIVEEFQKTVRKELNFIEEGKNCCRLRKSFEDSLSVYIPRVYPDFLSERVLVMEQIQGVRIDDIEAIDAQGFDRAGLASTVVDAYFKMILEDGFFHADPHPGNIFVMPSGQIAFMDFGIVGKVNDRLKEAIANTFVAFIKRDYDRLIDQYIELGLVPEEMDTGDLRGEFREDLEEVLEPFYAMTLGEINFSEYLEAFIRIGIKHNMKIPTDLLLIDKTMLILEDIATRLNPGFEVITASEPYVNKLLREKLSPARVLEKVSGNVNEFAEFFVLFPRQTKKVFQKVLRNDLQVKMTHIGLETLIKDMDRSSNRVAFAVVLAALLLSSAIMHAAGVGPTVYGMSLMGFAVFGFAAILGVWLLISIFRSGRL